MSLRGAIARGVGRLNPSLDTRIAWMRYRRSGPSLRLIDEIVNKGDVAIDIGAADALYAARLSQLVGRRRRVYAFEPNPAQFKHVEALSARRANVTAYPMGLSDRGGVAQLHVPVLDDELRPGLGSVGLPGSRAGIEHREVSVVLERLDTLLAENSLPTSFLKCDVEGHELAVLRGAEETLRRAKPKILIEIEQRHQDAPVQMTVDFLGELGYVGYSVHPHSLRPVEEFSVEQDQLAYLGESFQEMVPPGYLNDFLFVPAGTDVTRLAAAVERTG